MVHAWLYPNTSYKKRTSLIPHCIALEFNRMLKFKPVCFTSPNFDPEFVVWEWMVCLILLHCLKDRSKFTDIISVAYRHNFADTIAILVSPSDLDFLNIGWHCVLCKFPK